MNLCLVVAFSIFGHVFAAPTCPPGYVLDSSGTCYSKTIFDGPQFLAYKNCALDNAFMFDIQNAFQNTNVQSMAQGKQSLWLGLTCLGNTFDSCKWDTGRTLSNKDYTNFAKGMPNADIGPCVYMNVKTGQWLSSDCAKTNASSICQLSTGVTIDYCRDESLFFRGRCYQAYISGSYDYDVCFDYLGGSLISIHSAGQNSFIRDVASLIGASNYVFLEMFYENGTGFRWVDGSNVGYMNFGYENISTEDSAAMALVDGMAVKRGQWLFLDKPANDIYTFVCAHAPDRHPDPPHHVIPVCPGTNSYNSGVRVASPGYPFASPATNCEYVITAESEKDEERGHVSLTFTDILLDGNSSITLHNNDIDNKPFVLTSTNYHPDFFYSFNSTLKLVFNTPGGQNFFKAYTRSGERQFLPIPSGHCNGGSFYGSGVMRSPNYPYNYPNDIRNCHYVLHSSKERIVLTFKDIYLSKHDSITVLDGEIGKELYFPNNVESESKGPYYNITLTSYTAFLTIDFQTSEKSKTERGFDAFFYSIY